MLGIPPVAILRPLLPSQDLPVQQDPVGADHLRPGAALRVLLQHGGGHAQAGQVLADLDGIERYFLNFGMAKLFSLFVVLYMLPTKLLKSPL